MSRLLWIMVLCCAGAFGQESAVRVNVVLVMADDLGWGDPAYNGHPFAKTPHLDAMSRSGLVFDRFYSASPVCSPTRGSCLTGRHPDRYGIPTANRGHLLDSEITLPEVLAEASYRTGHFGKWHLGTLSPDYSGKGPGRQPKENYCTPSMAGFSEWFSTEFAVATWDPYAKANSHLSKKMPWDPRALYWENGVNIEEPLEGCDSRLIMERALGFITRSVKAESPFLAVIWFHAPHAPVIGGEAYRKLYANRSDDEQHYFATVTALDEQVGRLRAHLRALDVADDTLLWFCSDNGPEGNPAPTGRHQGSAGSLRGRKRSLYEGGIRVPGILEWPRRIPEAQRTSLPSVTTDILPTVLSALGMASPDDRPLDGVDLMPLVRGKMTTRPDIAFRFGPQSALIGSRWKLVENKKLQRPRSDNGEAERALIELYDLERDPSETKNVAAEHPELTEAMTSKLRETIQSWK